MRKKPQTERGGGGQNLSLIFVRPTEENLPGLGQWHLCLQNCSEKFNSKIFSKFFPERLVARKSRTAAVAVLDLRDILNTPCRKQIQISTHEIEGYS